MMRKCIMAKVGEANKGKKNKNWEGNLYIYLKYGGICNLHHWLRGAYEAEDSYCLGGNYNPLPLNG